MANKKNINQPLNPGKKPADQQRYANPGQPSRNPSQDPQKGGFKDAPLKNNPSKGREGRDTSW